MANSPATPQSSLLSLSSSSALTRADVDALSAAESSPPLSTTPPSSNKRNCLLCRQRFSTPVALTQHVKQQHTCAQCTQVARVAYKVDAEGLARRLCSKCAVTELLEAAIPGAPRTVSPGAERDDKTVAAIAPVAPLSPRSAYAQAVLQARVRASLATSAVPVASEGELSPVNKNRRRNTRSRTLSVAEPTVVAPPLPPDEARVVDDEPA